MTIENEKGQSSKLFLLTFSFFTDAYGVVHSMEFDLLQDALSAKADLLSGARKVRHIELMKRGLWTTSDEMQIEAAGGPICKRDS